MNEKKFLILSAIFLILSISCAVLGTNAQATMEPTREVSPEITPSSVQNAFTQAAQTVSANPTEEAFIEFTPSPAPRVVLTNAAQTVIVNLTQLAQDSTSTGNASSSQITLVPFNYKLQDAGDGWNDGQVALAFENKTDDVISIEQINLSKPTVQTKEGITYPASLLIVKGGGGFSISSRETTQITFYEEMLIPPGFRFSVERIGVDRRWYSVEWRSAVAATPSRIVFESNPEFDFNLPDQKQAPFSFPFEVRPSQTASFSDLSEKKAFEDPGGVDVTLKGQCATNLFFDSNAFDLYRNAYYLKFQAQNKDRFQEQRGYIIFPLSQFHSDGTLLQTFTSQVDFDLTDSYIHDDEEIVLGPNQNKTGYLYIAETSPDETTGPTSSNDTDLPPIVVAWSDKQTYTIYDTSECLSR